jgi:hypothetical protein
LVGAFALLPIHDGGIEETRREAGQPTVTGKGTAEGGEGLGEITRSGPMAGQGAETGAIQAPERTTQRASRRGARETPAAAARQEVYHSVTFVLPNRADSEIKSTKHQTPNSKCHF